MLLSSSRQQDIQKRFHQLAIKRSDPDMLELTYFSDKRLILQKLHQSKGYASFLPDKSYIDQLTELKDLRNTLAHTGNTADDHDILREFIDRLRIAHHWIESIEQWQSLHSRTTP